MAQTVEVNAAGVTGGVKFHLMVTCRQTTVNQCQRFLSEDVEDFQLDQPGAGQGKLDDGRGVERIRVILRKAEGGRQSGRLNAVLYCGRRLDDNCPGFIIRQQDYGSALVASLNPLPDMRRRAAVVGDSVNVDRVDSDSPLSGPGGGSRVVRMFI